MTWITALIVAQLFGVGIFMILHRSFIRVVIGLSLITHAANLFVLSLSGSPVGKSAPVIEEGVSNYADPLPQALVLTAIVIGFGATSYLIVLLYRLYRDKRTTDIPEVFE